MSDVCVSNDFVGFPPFAAAALKSSRERRRLCRLVFSVSGVFVSNIEQQPILLGDETVLRSLSRGGGSGLCHCGFGRQGGLSIPTTAIAGSENDCRAVVRDFLGLVYLFLARAGAGARTGKLVRLSPLLRGLVGRAKARVGSTRRRLS